MRLLSVMTIVLVLGISTLLKSQSLPVIEKDVPYVLDVAWSNDSTKLAIAGIKNASDGYLRIMDTSTRSIIYSLDPIASGFTSVAWSTDDSRLAVGSFDQTIWIFDTKTWQNIGALRGHQATITSVTWLDTGMQLMSSGNWDQRLILWDTQNYTLIASLDIADPTSLAFNPVTQQVAVGSLAGLYIFPSDLLLRDKPKRDYRIFNRPVASVEWSPSYKRIAFSTTVFDLPNTPEYNSEVFIADNVGIVSHQFQTNNKTISGLDWSKDGLTLATASVNGAIEVWSLASSQTIVEYISGISNYPIKAEISPFSGRLAFGSVYNPQLIQDSPNLNDLGLPIQIVVPIATVERFAEIAASCNAPAALTTAETQLQAQSADVQSQLLAQLDTLPEDAIPVGCEADLRAIAEAMQAG